MVSEAIGRIKEAEKAAEDAGRAARAEGKRLVATAHDAAERLLDETRRAAWEREKELIAQAASQAEADARALVQESKASVKSVREAAEGRLETGIKKVLELITAGAATTRG